MSAAATGPSAISSLLAGERRGLGALLLIAVVAFAYAPALNGTWLWDDGYEVAHNPVLRDPAGLAKIWRGEAALDYFPVKATVQWLLWRVWADHPAGWHATSALLHAVSALLVWRLLRRLGVRWPWLGAVLFAVHPLAVESVAWIAELKNTLSLPLALLAMDAYLDYDERGRGGDLARSLALFVTALLCKSTIVAVPGVLALFVWWRHGRVAARAAWSLVPYFAAALVLGLVTIWFQHERAIGGAEVPVGDFATRAARAALALGFYAWKAVWPIELMPVYPRWAIAPWMALLFVPWAVLAIWAWCRRAQWGRHVLFGGGVFVANLAPILGFIAMAYMHVTWVADHFAYAALPAAAGLLAAAAEAIARRARASAAIAAAVVLSWAALWAVLSRGHAALFRDAETFWAYAVDRNPDSPVARNNLGNALLARGRPEEAAAQLGAAVRLAPRDAGSRINHGMALAQLGRIEDALAEHQRAVALAPLSPVAANALGGTLLDAGRIDEARRQFEAALRLQPSYAEAHNNLGIALGQAGDAAGARRHFEQALRLKPDLGAARANLARTAAGPSTPQ